MVSREYIRRREALIPKAENIANKKHGANKPKNKAELEAWAGKWTRTFLTTMDKLWEKEKRKEQK